MAPFSGVKSRDSSWAYLCESHALVRLLPLHRCSTTASWPSAWHCLHPPKRFLCVCVFCSGTTRNASSALIAAFHSTQIMVVCMFTPRRYIARRISIYITWKGARNVVRGSTVKVPKQMTWVCRSCCWRVFRYISIKKKSVNHAKFRAIPVD